MKVVIVTCGSKSGAEKWKKDAECPFTILIDSSRKLYQMFGMNRSIAKVWGTSSMNNYAENIIAGQKLFAPFDNDDVNQMGGDIIISKSGVIRFLHVSKTSFDRPSLQDILQIPILGQTII